MRFLAILLALSGPVLAEEQPLSAAEFEAFTRGRTLHFTWNGLPYGAEQFLSGQRSLWRFPDGTCGNGSWRETNGLICFTYDNLPQEQCWRVTRQAGLLRAEQIENGAPTGFSVQMSHAGQDRLLCPGPDAGV